MDISNGSSIDFSINKELAEKFSMALKLNNESSQDVMTHFMKQYIAETFAKVSEEVQIAPSTNVYKASGETLKNEKKKSENTKITNEMVATAYQYAKRVYFGEMTRQEGKAVVAQVSGMNEGSAQDYITDFLAMMEGKEYQRVMSNYGTAYYLENIRKDFGEAAFKKANEATEKHIKYYKQLGYGKLKQKEQLVNRYKEMLKERV